MVDELTHDYFDDVFRIWCGQGRGKVKEVRLASLLSEARESVERRDQREVEQMLQRRQHCCDVVIDTTGMSECAMAIIC